MAKKCTFCKDCRKEEKEEAKMKVIGKKPYEFTAKDSGIVYNGLTLFCLDNLPAPGVGQYAEKISVGKDKECYNLAVSLEIGDEVTPIYSKFGKVTDLLIKKIAKK